MPNFLFFQRTNCRTKGFRKVGILSSFSQFSNNSLISNHLNSGALLDTSKPMMSPKRPRIELKISITRTLTNLQRKGVSLFITHTYLQPNPPSPGERWGGGEGEGGGFLINSQAWIRGISQRCTAAIDSNRNTANEVTHPHRQPSPEERKARVEVSARVNIVAIDWAKLCRKYNCHNDPVDGDNFAKNDRYQVLRPYSRRLYTSA